MKTVRTVAVFWALSLVLAVEARAVVVADAPPAGISYLVFEHWGGTWYDAEKSPTSTEDDQLCWAAVASNVLAWTDWGPSNADDVFTCFQDHWTDEPGMTTYAWGWWFSGINAAQGWSGWSQVDVPGGGFYPNEDSSDYIHSTSTDTLVLSAIDQYLHSGYGVAVTVYGSGAHAITCWGYSYNPDNPSEYLGLWITDSDDSKSLANAPDRLRYYEVECVGDKWFLRDFYGSDDWFLGAVQALGRSPYVPGDANGDGVVDDGDASILGTHWMHPGTWADGDFNGDSMVNDADAAILAAHWGEGVGEESVPEPGSLALLAGIAVMGMVYVRRRKA